MEYTATPTADEVIHAGFWRRYLALFLDQLILGCGWYLLAAIILVPLALGGAIVDWDAKNAPAWLAALYLGLAAVYYFSAAAYYSLQESSVHQATVGKRALGIKVTDAHGRRLTRGQALGRWFAAALSYLTLYIGFLMAAFTQRKRALHDIVAGTLVVDRWAFTDHPERQQHGLSGCLVAFIVAVLLMCALAALGILAAIAIPAYQDYTVRAKVGAAIAAAAPLQATVAAYRGGHASCPTNDEGGIRPADAYAQGNVAKIEVGALDDGDRCAIQIGLRALSAGIEDGQNIWLELDPETAAWTCTSELDDKYLPMSCRG